MGSIFTKSLSRVEATPMATTSTTRSPATTVSTTSAGTTFKVNNVTKPKKPLGKADYADVLQHRCGNVKPEAFSPPRQQVVEELRGLTRIIGIDNGLISAIHTAWSSHYPLTLTPDIIWLCIAQGLAQHINTDYNAEKLRHLFVEHEDADSAAKRFCQGLRE